MATPKKTSQQWFHELKDIKGKEFYIEDPTGWDDENYNYAFMEEEITKAEFNTRLKNSKVVKEKIDLHLVKPPKPKRS